ncbi:MAG TPA: LysR family transcriptional regulator, partial [Desulfobacterales bacterium]|nr:LysR family transcriptional regulator [Desulfobacterales bacterium]
INRINLGSLIMDNHKPIVRLHLWLEENNDVFFGFGRAQLLENIARYGSLKKAAESLGMSYRAAWGKIKKTEAVLGCQLLAKSGSNREGYRLTAFGNELKDKYSFWFKKVEQDALKTAEEIFPWLSKPYQDKKPE